MIYRFVEDNGENPTLGLGALLGSLVEWNGNYSIYLFSKVGALECNPVTVEITYGLERILCIRKINQMYDITWNMHNNKNNLRDIFKKMKRTIIL